MAERSQGIACSKSWFQLQSLRNTARHLHGFVCSAQVFAYVYLQIRAVLHRGISVSIASQPGATSALTVLKIEEV